MESSSGDVNYWPGFVDALSNVVLTLVFVLVIFVFALVMASNKVEQRFKEIVDAHEKTKQQQIENVKDAADIEKLKAELAQAAEKIKQLEQQLDGSIIKDNKEILVKDVEETNGSAKIADSKDNRIAIKFLPSVVNMDEESQTALDDTLKQYEPELKSRKFIIKAYKDKASLSIGQRLAYYRILGLRNFLISKVGIPPASISAKIIESDSNRAGYVEISFEQQ